MTSTNKPTHSCPASQGPSRSSSPSPYSGLSSGPQPAKANDTYFAAFAPAFQAVAGLMMLLLVRAIAAFEKNMRTGCARDSKTLKLAIMAMALIIAALKGSRLEKTLFLKKLFAKHRAKLDRMYARYLVWRQRKMWMWNGGFVGAALAAVPDVFVAALDERSFDALIPD